MKGSLDNLSVTFIQLSLVLVITAWAVTPLYGGIQIARQNSARLNAQEISSIINMMKASPVDVQYKVLLPNVDCKVRIRENHVEFQLSAGGKEENFVSYFVQGPVSVSADSDVYECSRDDLMIEKRSDRISVSRS